MIAHYLAICGPKRWPHILGLLYLGSYPTFGELTVWVCDTGLDESRPLIRLVARPFLASHFLSIVIALSKGFVACLNGARLAQSPDCRRREGEVACYFNSIQRVNSSSMPNTQSSFRTWAHEYFSFRRVAADQPGVSALLYAARRLKVGGSSRPGRSANTLTAESHTCRCSCRSYLARSISTLLRAASFVQTP